MSLTKQTIMQQCKHVSDEDIENHVSLYCTNICGTQHPSNGKSYIFIKDELFFEGYPYSEELTENDDWSHINLNNCRFFEAHEGTLIRVFNINGKWYTSTNRKLNAIKSKWASKQNTFGFHFAEALRQLIDDDSFEESNLSEPFVKRFEKKEKDVRLFLESLYETNLNKNYKYMFFLMPSEEERIVCDVNNPKFYNIGVFDENNKLSFDLDVSFNGCLVEKSKEFDFKELTKRDISQKLQELNHFESPGYIVIEQKPDQVRHFKFLNKTYKYLFDLRNNNPNIKLQYLTLRRCENKNDDKKLIDFINLYNYYEESKNIEELIWKISNNLHKFYMMKYIERIECKELTEKEQITLVRIHGFYKNTNIKTTPTRISEILTILDPREINTLIKELNKKELENKKAE